MEIANAEFGSVNVNRKEDSRATGEVLDVAVSSVLGTPWDRSCAFFSDFLFQFSGSRACMNILGLWRLSDDSFEFGS